MRVAIYSRISENPDGTSTGTARQERDCRELAASMEWEVARVYREDDTSAFGTKPRPVFEAMVSDIKAGSYDGLLVWKLDRLTRKLKDLATVVDAIETGHAFVRTVEGGIDTSNNGSHLLLTIQVAIGNEESRNTSLRISRKHLELAEGGKIVGGGSRPFGLSYDRRTLIEEEAQIIRGIATAILNGESLTGIASRLNKEEVETIGGNFWRPSTVRRMMMSARLAGVREYKGKVYPSDEIPAILDWDTVVRIRVILNNPDRAPKHKHRETLLSGFLYCECGHKLHAKPLPRRAGRVAGWQCVGQPMSSGCGKITVVNEPVELVATEALLHRLDTPALSESASAQDTSRTDMQKELAAIKERAAGLTTDHYVLAVIDRSSFLAAYEPLKARMEKLEVELAKAPVAPMLEGFAGRAREEWQKRSISERRALLAQVVSRIVVRKTKNNGRFFNPERVAIEWRF